MSEFSDAVRILAEAAASLNAAAGSIHQGQGTQPGTPTTPAGLSGAQQVQALNAALGQTAQHAQAATTSLNSASRSAQGFLGQFAESRIRQFGFNLISTGISAIADEAGRLISSASAVEEFARATGQLPEGATTVRDLTASISDLRTEAEALITIPTLSIFEQRLNSLDTTAGRSKVKDVLTGIGDALGRITEAHLTGVEAGLNSIGNVAGPLFSTLSAIGINLPSLPPVPDSVAASYQGLEILASEFAESQRQARIEAQGLQDQLGRLGEEARNVRANYDAGVQPLRDQLDTINKEYDAAARLRALTTAQRDVSREQALAVDVFSAAGQAANQALPGDLQRLQDLQNAQAHQQTVDELQAQIDALTKGRDSALAEIDKKRSAAASELSTRQSGISSEEEARVGARREAATIAAQHMSDVHDTHQGTAQGNPPFLPAGTESTSSFRYGGAPQNNSVTINLNLNGVSGSMPADVEREVRALFAKPSMQSWVSRMAAGK